jgi:replication-associated recombination protein RarA
MIGQDKILSQLDKLSASTFPKSLILSGEVGCGKHTLCSLIKDKFNVFEFKFVKDKITYDFVENCFLLSVPSIYVIEADNLSVREQNALLKLFEEPPENLIIILITNNILNLLNTIRNRAVVWEFDKYSQNVLRQFLKTEDDRILDLVSTPGQILELTSESLSDMINLCDTMIDRMANASISNALSIVNKFKFSNKENKGFELTIFLRLMRKILLKRLQVRYDKYLIEFYVKTNDFYYQSLTTSYNKNYLFNEYILNLKLINDGH